ncbi:hypothetical protein DFH06DRAFT_1148090 [Mycena polygramma]|nr:hypothetical protein DFH06DRAFT_1148090 [Mycena polygramma]
MGWFVEDSEEAEAYLEVGSSRGWISACADKHVRKMTTAPPDAELSHELISAAAAYEASEAYEAHVKMQGRPHSFVKAKEVLAALTAILVDHVVDSRGLNTIDKAKVTDDANKRNEEKLAQDYNEY